MFDFLLSEDQKMRRSAAHWLEMARRVHDYRRDQLSTVQLEALQAATSDVRAKVKEKAAAGVMKPAIEKLEAVMREIGGRVYPAGSMVETSPVSKKPSSSSTLSATLK